MKTELVAYRLRSYYGRWWLVFDYNTGPSDKGLGPFTYHQAIAEAEKMTVPDGDRLTA